MKDWQQGGWTGSINRFARREVRNQFRNSQTARQARYGYLHLLLQAFFRIGTFGRFIGLYLVFDFMLIIIEVFFTSLTPTNMQRWLELRQPLGSSELLLSISSYLIGAQVGVLGVISLALALVTLIAQRENSSTDIKVYYHESFAFELVASCTALLAVLCAQLLWPTRTFLNWIGVGTDVQVFKFGLLYLHLWWLLINIAGLAHFVATTFGFVQQSERERLRQRYTANVVLPLDLIKRLRQQLYTTARTDLISDGAGDKRPSVTFGLDYGTPFEVEVRSVFTRPVALHDVRMKWVRWALCRWAERSTKAATAGNATPAGLRHQEPHIWFTPHMDGHLVGPVSWCRRRGGVPLDRIERLVLRYAFRFRSIASDT